MSVLFQVGMLAGFLQGIYEGDLSFEKISAKGNCGLGTVDQVAGEMIGLDGVFYCIDAHGHASVIPPEQCTPFALVSQFHPVLPIDIANVPTLPALNEILDNYISTKNIFYMIRIDGVFESVKLRSESCQVKIYQPLIETLPKLQYDYELASSSGTLIVSRCPSYATTMTIPGYHYHYIDDARKTGGHVNDLSIKHAKIQINALRTFEMHLINSHDLEAMNLDIDVMRVLKAIEGKCISHTDKS